MRSMNKIWVVTLLAGAAVACGGKHKDKGMAAGSASGAPVASGEETAPTTPSMPPPETRPAPPPEPPAPPPLPPKTPAEMAQRYQDCWGLFNTQKWDDFKGCYTSDAVSTQPGTGMPDVTGADAIVAAAKAQGAAFPDQKGALQLVLQNGNHTAAIAVLMGTNTGPMQGPQGELPPTKKKFSMAFGHEVDFDPSGTMAAHETAYGDMGTLLAQLGVVKMPARGPVKAWAKSTEVVIANNDDAEKANVDAVGAWVDTFNKHDLKAYSGYLAKKLVWSDYGEPKDLDLKGAIADAKSFWAGFSDVKIAPDSVWAAGDYVVLNGTMSGTNDGNLPAMHLKKTGKSFSAPFLQIMKLDGGKVSRCWIFYQTIGFAAQLGLIPGK